MLFERCVEQWQNGVFQIALRAKGVQHDTITFASGKAEHRGSHGGDVNGGWRSFERWGREIGGHEIERKMFAGKIQAFARVPAVPDGFYSLDDLFHSRGRGGPGLRKPSFDVAFDLAAEPQNKSAARCPAQFPSDLSGNHGTSSKGDGNRGSEFQRAA